MIQEEVEYTQEDAEHVSEVEKELEERFREFEAGSELESDEEDDSCVSTGVVVGFETVRDDIVSLEIRHKGSEESFSSNVALPDSRDDMDNEWNLLCAHAGVSDPTRVREIMYEEIPICEGQHDWIIDTPSEWTAKGYLGFKLRRLGHKTGLLSLDRGQSKVSERSKNLLFRLNAILMVPALYLFITFDYWTAALSETPTSLVMRHVILMIYILIGGIAAAHTYVDVLSKCARRLNEKCLKNPW